MNPIHMAMWILIGAGIGAGAGSVLGNIALGAIAGALLGWPIGLALRTRQRRWIAVMSLIVNYLIAWELAGWGGVLLAVACTGITLFLSAAVLRELYNCSEVEAFSHHIRILTGLQKGFHVVSEGKTVTPAGDGPFMGPLQLVIKPNTAVILEQGGKHTYTLGPGFHTTKPFEYVRHIFNLHPQMINYSMANVRTRDHLTVTIQFTIVIAVRIPASIRTGAKTMNDPKDSNYSQYDKYRQRLQRIYDIHNDWESSTKAEIESQVRRYSANLSLNELTDALRYQDLALTVVRGTNQRVNKWGIWVERAIVERIEPSRSIADTMEEQWVGELRRKAAADAERAQARGLADALSNIAIGYRNARAQGVSQGDINRILLLRTLERITDHPGINLHLSAGIIADLNDLRRMLGLPPPTSSTSRG